MRTHIILPAELVKEMDRLVGKRRRSKFMEEAVKEKLRREALGSALKETAGVLKGAVPPEWESPEKAADWVAGLRAEETRRLESKLGGLGAGE